MGEKWRGEWDQGKGRGDSSQRQRWPTTRRDPRFAALCNQSRYQELCLLSRISSSFQNGTL